jgi:chloride channel 3/4/5
MGGTELVYTLFSECRKGPGDANSSLCVLDPSTFQNIWPAIRAMLVTMLIKGGLTVVTFGIKLPAGIFIPSLGVGACAGRVLGIVMQWMQYQMPQSRLFEACKGDLDCECPVLIVFLASHNSLECRYYPWSICHGWGCSCVVGCDGKHSPLKCLFVVLTDYESELLYP